MNCANTEAMFRIIQSIPSPKAEPFKLWLAKVGYERVQEIENPELAAERARHYYRDVGYDEKWIETRLQTIAIRGQTGSLNTTNCFASRRNWAMPRRIWEGRYLGCEFSNRVRCSGLRNV